jgi:alkylhydroperoxidase family enzyme
MTWIKTVPPNEDPEVAKALQEQGELYPREYRSEGRAERRELHPLVMNDSIVLSHSLIPEALKHAFSTFGAIMAPHLPLSRRDHEMIAATVSATNRCFY